MTTLTGSHQSNLRRKIPRFIIATPICDGHDVAAAAITRLIRAAGAEAIYIGFNKSPQQIVKATIEEDASGIALSTYNGGHMTFVRELRNEQAKHGVSDVPLFCGGGGTILPGEVKPLERMGVAKVYRPPLDLMAAVTDMIERARLSDAERNGGKLDNSSVFLSLSRQLTDAEWGICPGKEKERESERFPWVWGIGGRGGAGKSTTIDELILRFLELHDGNIGVLAVDPTLGDRLRMLYCYSPRVFLRSTVLGPGDAIEDKVPGMVDVMKHGPFDLILVESVGLGQNDLGVAPYVDGSIYCMTPDYGTDVQLEKEALLQRADIIAMNKRDYPQALTRSKRVQRRLRNDQSFVLTEAKQHNDPGITDLFHMIASRSDLDLKVARSGRGNRTIDEPIPQSRRNYLGNLVDVHESYYYEMNEQLDLVKDDPTDSMGYREWFADIWRKYGFDSTADSQEELATAEDGVLCRTDVDGNPTPVARQTFTGIWVPVLGLPPRNADLGQIVQYCYKQNVPGSFPFTEGAYIHRRRDQDPIRMFAGLGLPETTNHRFHLLSSRHGAPRLSTAFDSLTLYGLDSDEPGALAKVGEGGVAVDTIDDMLRLYDGFDLEKTSVSMTMNGPAPMILALYLAAARRQGFDWARLRGTIQTDILKEVQAQNESVFPLEPSLRLIAQMIGFTMREAPLWYPISISGYHIGEAGANPIQELAFTLANGFTYVEVLKNHGLPIEDFARRFSFFFTSGSDLEFNVLGRVARRIWAIGMQRYYGVVGSGQALRYHSQTSGRSLQDVEPLHNLTRVALQAEHALHNNTNSLHTNSYKETYTTPEEDDVLLAMGSQQVPLIESGDFLFTENLHQGSYGISYLEDEVERAVHNLFREIDAQGGVIPAIENEYFRTAIQEEVQKEYRTVRDGHRKIVGVNYMVSDSADRPRGRLVNIPVTEKRKQARRTRAFKIVNMDASKKALGQLRDVARDGGDVFEQMIDTVEVATVGQITRTLWDVWGRFRPSM